MNAPLLRPPLTLLPLLMIPLVLILVALEVRAPRSASTTAISPPPEADYYLRDAELRTMDEDGALLYRVRAERVLHFPDDTVSLEQVQVDYLDGPWEVTARAGEMTPGAARLDLNGSVHMHGKLRSGEQIALRTERISVHFDERRIDTVEPVTMESGHYTAEAVGMRTDLDGRELRLASQVRVSYEP